MTYEQNTSTAEAIENLKGSSKELISAMGNRLHSSVSEVLEEPFDKAFDKIRATLSDYDPRPIIKENPKTSLAAAVAIGTVVALNARHILRFTTPFAGILINAGFLLLESRLAKTNSKH